MKSKLIVTFLCIMGLTTALLFNNCQPIADGIKAGGSGSEASIVSKSAGQLLFEENLIPAFQTSCASCHDNPANPAPSTIYNYDAMRALVQIGPYAQENPLINRLNGVFTHPGGALCLGDPLPDFCGSIYEWSLTEFPLQTTGIAGQLFENDALGRIRGWVQNPALSEQILEAHVYAGAAFDDPETVLVGTFTANQPIEGAEYGDGHAFSFQLPEQFRNGDLVDLYVYGAAPGAILSADNLIPLMPTERAGYSPSLAGEAIYQNNLEQALNTQCLSCHANDMNYGVNWLRLSEPSPFENGTATDNLIINTITSEDHGDGVFCDGDKNQEPCLSLQLWWQAEFASISQVALSASAISRLQALGDQVFAGVFNQQNLYISNDNGGSFSTVDLFEVIPNARLFDIFVEPGRILLATTGGLISSIDGGATFTAVPNAAVNMARVYAAGDLIMIGTNTNYLFSLDGGVSFETRPYSVDGVGAPTDRAIHISIVGEVIYVVTLAGIEISRDGGATFTATPLFDVNGGHYLHTSGNEVYISAVQGGFWRSLDAGLTFEEVDMTAFIPAGTATRGSHVAPNGLLYLGTDAGLLVSKDKGLTFSRLPVNGYAPGEGIGRVRVNNDGKIFIGANSGLFVSR